MDEAKSLLSKYQVRLDDTKTLISRADKMGSANPAAYLASRDEVKFLTDEIFRLNSFIVAGDARQTRLTTPIYASAEPVFPQKKIIIIIGPLLGLLTGFVLVIVKKVITQFYVMLKRS
jgi:hypothetical protein